MAKKIMAHNGQNFDAYYSVIMPDTWTPVFDLTNKNRVDKWLSDGKKQLICMRQREKQRICL